MFNFTVTEIFCLDVGLIVLGKGTHPSYAGRLACGDIGITVQGGFPGSANLDKVSLLVAKGAELIDDSFIGKTFKSI